MPELHEKPAFLCKKCSHFSHTSRLGLVTPDPGRLAVMVGRAGIEPATNWLKANCSTSELTARRGAYSTAPARKNKQIGRAACRERQEMSDRVGSCAGTGE